MFHLLLFCVVLAVIVVLAGIETATVADGAASPGLGGVSSEDASKGQRPEQEEFG